MKPIVRILLACSIILASLLHSQPFERRDKAIFIQPKNEFMDSVEKALSAFRAAPLPAKPAVRPDFSAFNPPTAVSEFTQHWHNKPVSQAISGMCWCFSTTSMLESEIYRQSKRQIKLSELYTVYWEYVEKARGYVRARGEQAFGEGSQANAVYRIWKQYGIVPAEAYTGLLNGQPFHDHRKLFDEMNTYLRSVKAAAAWNEDAVIATVRDILNHNIGEPPAQVTVNGQTMTPQEYLRTVVKLNADDYVAFCSFMDRPYYAMTEYEVTDNWWHSKAYFNIPLNEYMATLKKVVRDGYTVALWGDVSEPGLEGHAGVAVVPTFDIPPQYIDESARQFRFSNGTTGDDHGIHIVGYVEKDGATWFLIKDSGSGCRNNPHPGYYFFHEDYVKLKMLGFGVHKSAVPEMAKQMK